MLLRLVLSRIPMFLSYVHFSFGVFPFLNSRLGGVRLPGEFGGPASVRVPPHHGVPSPFVFYPPVYIPPVDMTLEHCTSPLGTPKIQKKKKSLNGKAPASHAGSTWIDTRILQYFSSFLDFGFVIILKQSPRCKRDHFIIRVFCRILINSF